MNGRPFQRLVGIDPGLAGALVFIDLQGAIVEVEDMPVIGKKDVNAHMIANLVRGYGPVTTAVVEKAQSMPGQGVSSVFNYGTGYGKILGVLAALEIPIVSITPSVWKKPWHLGTDKSLSRRRATDRWPEWADSFKRAKDDGRAEAALMVAGWLLTQPARRIVHRRLVPD